jgi:hypothetical protein
MAVRNIVCCIQEYKILLKKYLNDPNVLWVNLALDNMLWGYIYKIIPEEHFLAGTELSNLDEKIGYFVQTNRELWRLFEQVYLARAKIDIGVHKISID